MRKPSPPESMWFQAVKGHALDSEGLRTWQHGPETPERLSEEAAGRLKRVAVRKRGRGRPRKPDARKKRQLTQRILIQLKASSQARERLTCIEDLKRSFPTKYLGTVDTIIEAALDLGACCERERRAGELVLAAPMKAARKNTGRGE